MHRPDYPGQRSEDGRRGSRVERSRIPLTDNTLKRQSAPGHRGAFVIPKIILLLCVDQDVYKRQLREHEQPWFDKKYDKADRFGSFGEIMPQEEVYFMIQAADEFELVRLEKGFVEEYKEKFFANPVLTDLIKDRIHDGIEKEALEKLLEDDAEGLYIGDRLVGAVKKAHDVDVALTSHVLLENLASKASNILSLLHLIKSAGLDPDAVSYTHLHRLDE